MGSPAARLTDMHVCPMVTVLVPHVGGPIVAPGAPTVLIGGLPAARVTDMAVCVGPPDVIVLGSFTVLTMSMPQARIGDLTATAGPSFWECSRCWWAGEERSVRPGAATPIELSRVYRPCYRLCHRLCDLRWCASRYARLRLTLSKKTSSS